MHTLPVVFYDNVYIHIVEHHSLDVRLFYIRVRKIYKSSLFLFIAPNLKHKGQNFG